MTPTYIFIASRAPLIRLPDAQLKFECNVLHSNVDFFFLIRLIFEIRFFFFDSPNILYSIKSLSIVRYLIKFEGKGHSCLQVVSVHALPGFRELQRHLVGQKEYYTYYVYMSMQIILGKKYLQCKLMCLFVCFYQNIYLVFMAELFWWFEVVKPPFVQPQVLDTEGRLILQ